MESAVYCWISDGCAWVRVVGQGTFLNSTGMKNFFKDATARDIRECAIDLAECTLVDSTFMGTITFVALRLRERELADHRPRRVRVLNCSKDNLNLFRNLGLDQVLEIEPG